MSQKTVAVEGTDVPLQSLESIVEQWDGENHRDIVYTVDELRFIFDDDDDLWGDLVRHDGEIGIDHIAFTSVDRLQLIVEGAQEPDKYEEPLLWLDEQEWAIVGPVTDSGLHVRNDHADVACSLIFDTDIEVEGVNESRKSEGFRDNGIFLHIEPGDEYERPDGL